MNVVLVSLSAAAFLLFGFFVVKKVDAFLNHQGDKGDMLRIGMEYPGMEETLAEEIKLLDDKYPGFALRLIGGNSEELCQMLKTDEIDIAILEKAPDKNAFVCVTKPLRILPVISEKTGQPIVRQLSDLKTSFILKRSAAGTELCGMFYRLLIGESG